eukprot:GHVT01029350.1.p1 GENE.GHVT01029350.1~~GHVT01029350.1.p1  ORF type:complete len:149 (-),score=51.32 GHVT01029350.1:182-628(-)
MSGEEAKPAGEGAKEEKRVEEPTEEKRIEEPTEEKRVEGAGEEKEFDVAKLGRFLGAKGLQLEKRPGPAEAPNEEEPDEGVKPKHLELNEVAATVVVERLEGQEHLVAVKTWEELRLPDELLKGIFRKGFRKPSKIQEEALPLLIGSE